MKKEVLLKLKEGDQAALKIVFDEYLDPLIQYSFSYLGDKEAAKDVVQQFYISLWKNRENIIIDTFESYLFVSVRNRSVNYLRDAKKWLNIDQAPQKTSYDPDEPPPDEQQRIIRSYLESGIAKLPKKCKHVFLLSKVEGLTYAEVAVEMGISIKTVERQMGIALKKLRAYMSHYVPQ